MATANLSSVDASDLHYNLFLGDVEFHIDGADFSAPWGWVPVLDFASGLRSIARSLPQTDEQVFEFTESDATLRFTQREGIVTVTSNYAEGGVSADAPYLELRDAADGFFDRVVEDLCRAYPELKSNPEIEALMAS